jgi:VanZ family protein
MRSFINKYPRLAAGAWATLILLLCAIPGAYFPTADWMELLSLDKLVHAGLFFVQYSLLMVVAEKPGGTALHKLLYFLLCVVYGMLLEVLQANWFPDRSADWLDVIANTAGTVMALVFSRRVSRLLAVQRGL